MKLQRRQWKHSACQDPKSAFGTVASAPKPANRQDMDRQRFVELVQEAWEAIPEPFAAKLDNVVLLVEDEPTSELLRALGLHPHRDTLFGLYQGVPLSQRGAVFGNHPPDTITIFYQPFLRRYRTEEQLRREITRTIVHEVAHHFGMTDAEIRRLGY